MGKRREAREIALKCLFQWDQRPEDGQELAEEVMQQWSTHADQREFCRRLLEAYWQDSSEIDERIQSFAQNWRLDRMSIVDRTVLRLATAEMLYLDDIPFAVSIDEAIELAKMYSTEKSGSFVNGILDRIHQTLAKPAVSSILPSQSDPTDDNNDPGGN